MSGLQNWIQTGEFETLTPYENFVYALKAKETKRHYPHRLEKFLTLLVMYPYVPILRAFKPKSSKFKDTAVTLYRNVICYQTVTKASITPDRSDFAIGYCCLFIRMKSRDSIFLLF